MNANLALLLAAAAGCAIALQASVNARLSKVLGDQPLMATYFSILGTVIASTLIVLALRPGWPATETLRATAWWHWIGGPLGALVVMSGTFLIPELGAARFIAFLVAGQLLASLFFDHFGIAGLVKESISAGKVAGALLVILGVVCIKFT